MPTNRPVFSAFVVTASLLLVARSTLAQTISVSGNPGLLRVTSAVAGSAPIPVSSSSTTYTVTTTNANRRYRVTARLDSPMPAGTTLLATFAAPPGATSLGAVALDNVARDLVINVPRNTNATQGITYQFVATASAGVIATATRSVTLTFVLMP